LLSVGRHLAWLRLEQVSILSVHHRYGTSLVKIGEYADT